MLDSPWEELLHYGLLVGAVIQLIAIAAIVVLPSEASEGEGGEEEAKDVQSNGVTGSVGEGQVARSGKKGKEKGVRKRRR